MTACQIMVLSTFPPLWSITLGQKMTVDIPAFCRTHCVHIGTAIGLRRNPPIFWKLFVFLSEQTKRGDEISTYEFSCFIRRLLWPQIQFRILYCLPEHLKCDELWTVCMLQYALWFNEIWVVSTLSPNHNPHQFHLSSICSSVAGQLNLSLKKHWLLYVPPVLKLKTKFCPHKEIRRVIPTNSKTFTKALPVCSFYWRRSVHYEVHLILQMRSRCTSSG